MSRPLLLFLDGQTLNPPGLEETLGRGGWDMEMLASNLAATRASHREIDLILLDPKLSGPAGFQAIQTLRNITMDIPVVLHQSSTEAQNTRSISGVAGQLERGLPFHQWVPALNGILASLRAEKHKFTAEDLFADILADLESDSRDTYHPGMNRPQVKPSEATPRSTGPLPEDPLENFVAPWEHPAAPPLPAAPPPLPPPPPPPNLTPVRETLGRPAAEPVPSSDAECTLSGIAGIRDPFTTPAAPPEPAPAQPLPIESLPSFQVSKSGLTPPPGMPAEELSDGRGKYGELLPLAAELDVSELPAGALSSLPQMPVTLPSAIAPTPPDIQIRSAIPTQDDYKFAESSSIPGLTNPERAGRRGTRPRGQGDPGAGDYLEEFGNYYLLEKIAVGGMAELFKARQRGVHNFEKIVAIKRILPHLSDNDEFVRMFIDEAKLAAQLTHPNIVQIFDLGKAAGSYYIAMEYVDGKDLRSLLRKVREFQLPFPEAAAAAITMKIAGALDYAHRKKGMNDKELKLVHRDISPQNVLLSGEGAVKLVDFGIAKAATKSTQTIAGALKGKLLYMSPEQALGEPLDCRSDIYSLGLVLFELLTGIRCFQADSELGVLEKVRLGKVQDVQIVNPKISREMASIVNRALQKDVDRRYPSARLLERDLKALLSRDGAEPVEHDIAEFANVLLNGTKEQVELLISSHFPQRPSTLEPRSFFPAEEEDAAVVPTVTPPGAAPSWTTYTSANVSAQESKKNRLLPVIAIILATAAIALWLFTRLK